MFETHCWLKVPGACWAMLHVIDSARREGDSDTRGLHKSSAISCCMTSNRSSRPGPWNPICQRALQGLGATSDEIP